MSALVLDSTQQSADCPGRSPLCPCLQAVEESKLQDELVTLQSSLFSHQLKLESSRRAQKHTQRVAEDLAKARDRLQSDLEAALRHRETTENYNQVTSRKTLAYTNNEQRIFIFIVFRAQLVCLSGSLHRIRSSRINSRVPSQTSWCRDEAASQFEGSFMHAFLFRLMFSYVVLDNTLYLSARS